MLSPSQYTDVDVRSHFHLQALPFTRELPVDKRWSHPQYDDAVRALHAVVQDRMSAAIVAPAGTGKTMVLRTLRHQLPEARYRVHYVKVTALSRRDFTRELCRVVQVEPTGHYNTLVQRFQQRALDLLEQDSLRPVLFIDEAHDMRPEVLASIRILTNFAMDSRLVVSVILAGQGRLRQLLLRQDLEAVRRRLAHFATLRLLQRPEVADYVAHRLRIVGGEPTLFAPDALDTIYEIAGGNLRATDRLALKALEQACAAGAQRVAVDHVIAARQHLLP